ncbi:MAG TPA: ABC transporter ATP-binding protein [Gemmatimonadaceae bacterium]
MHDAIAVERLTKRYQKSTAVDDLSFSVSKGSIVALLGPNGSGKTTTLDCMTGLRRATSGEVCYQGYPLTPALFQRLAYVPDYCPCYASLSVADHVEMTRRQFTAFEIERAQALLTRFSLDPRSRVGTLSKGQRTALSMTLAFAVRRDYFIPDEPTSWLDPAAQRQALDVLVEAASDGASILISTHNVAHIERVADGVVIISKGRLVVSEATEELLASHKRVEAVFESAEAATRFAQGCAIGADSLGSVVRIYVNGDAAEFVAAANGLGARSVRVVDCSLEDVYLEEIARAARTEA